MPKFYLSTSNSSTDETQALSADYAITMNASQVRFFVNKTHKKNLDWSGGYSQATKSKFESLGAEFTKFFSGNNANTSNISANNNAFAYMRTNANRQSITNNSGLSWD